MSEKENVRPRPKRPPKPKPKADPNDFDQCYEAFRQRRVDFSREALDEVMTFLKNDNRIVSAYADIVETMRDDLKENPSRIHAGGLSSSAGTAATAEGHVKGANIFNNFIDAHAEIILADKDLAWKLIDKLIPDPLIPVPPLPPLPPIPSPSGIGDLIDKLNPFKW